MNLSENKLPAQIHIKQVDRDIGFRPRQTDCNKEKSMASASWVNEPAEMFKPILEDWVQTVQLLWVQLCQLLNRSVEDASPPESYPSSQRSLQELIVDYEDKIKKLKWTVEAICQRQPANYFEEFELYYLIRHVQENNWIHLMRILRVSDADMERCRNMSTDRKEQKYQMLKVWLRQGQNRMTSFKEELIFALDLLECQNIASMFRSGRSVMSTPS
ncbi:uncharacterized protein ACMZJ9_016622 [Mantella aurantiaca]